MIGIGKTDKGKVRDCNEDSLLSCNEAIGNLSNLYIIADGMGGHKAGDIASKSSIEYFLEYVKEDNEDNDVLDILVSGVKYANKKVFELAGKNPEYFNMGTTFLAASIRDNKMYIAHVGDCRLYILREGKLAQITTDHTFVMEMVKAGVLTAEESRKHPNRNMITRAVGVDEDILIDGLFSTIFPNDLVILCSDGLFEMLSNEEILNIAADERLDKAAKLDKLIDVANNNGGKDNISAILID